MVTGDLAVVKEEVVSSAQSNQVDVVRRVVRGDLLAVEGEGLLQIVVAWLLRRRLVRRLLDYGKSLLTSLRRCSRLLRKCQELFFWEPLRGAVVTDVDFADCACVLVEENSYRRCLD